MEIQGRALVLTLTLICLISHASTASVSQSSEPSNSSNVEPPKELYTGPTTKPSTSTQASTLNIDVLGHHNKPPSRVQCSTHTQCSCIGGIPICHEGYCSCIYSNFLCFSQSDCSHRCPSGIGICLINVCKCYKLTEDQEMSRNVSPFEHERQQ